MAWLKLAASLNIAPREFWRLSLKEWRALTQRRHAPLKRADLDALMRMYPDEQG